MVGEVGGGSYVMAKTMGYIMRRFYDATEQSRIMLEALEAPLADSRAAAVNIRLISCIGRQAKIGFCLQTHNSFNLLCLEYKRLPVEGGGNQI